MDRQLINGYEGWIVVAPAFLNLGPLQAWTMGSSPVYADPTEEQPMQIPGSSRKWQQFKQSRLWDN